MTSDRSPGHRCARIARPRADERRSMYRQGDVLLVAVEAIPDDAERAAAPRPPGPRRGRGHRPRPRHRRARRPRVPRRRRALRARPLGRPAHPRGARHDRPAARRLPRRHPARVRAGPDPARRPGAGWSTDGRSEVATGAASTARALGVVPAENFELANGWIPTSRTERHCDLVNRRIECVPPMGRARTTPPTSDHGTRATARRTVDCPNCFDDTQMDFGEWDWNPRITPSVPSAGRTSPGHAS